MSVGPAVDTALVVGVLLLVLLVVRLLQVQADLARRVDGLEREGSRRARAVGTPRPADAGPVAGPAGSAGTPARAGAHVPPPGVGPALQDVDPGVADRAVPQAAPWVSAHPSVPVGPVPHTAVAAEVGDGIDVHGEGPDGSPVSVALERVARPTLLAFLSTSCTICTGVWERLRDGGLAADGLDVDAVVIAKSPAQEDVRRVQALSGHGSGLQVVLSGEAWDDYEVPGSPYLLLLAGAPAQVVAEGAVSRWEDVVALARRGAG